MPPNLRARRISTFEDAKSSRVSWSRLGDWVQGRGFRVYGHGLCHNTQCEAYTLNLQTPKKLKQHPEPESPERTTSVWEDCGVQVLAWVQDSSSGNVVLMLVDICFLLKTSTLALYKT